MELHQKTLFERRSFFLLDNKIKLYLKDTGGEYENYIAYENLKPNTLIYYGRHNHLFFIALFLTSLSACIALYSILDRKNIIYIIFILLAALCLILFYKLRQQKYLLIETLDRQNIFFLKDKPSSEDLHFFLVCLWQKRKNYLRKKYFYLNLRNNLQQEIERLKWLLEQKAITPSEFILAKDDWIIDRRN